MRHVTTEDAEILSGSSFSFPAAADGAITTTAAAAVLAMTAASGSFYCSSAAAAGATAAAVSAANLYRPGPRASDYMCFGREIPPDFPSDFLTTTIFDQKDYSLSFQKLFPSQTLCHICFAPHHSPFVSLPFAVATHMSHQSHTHYFPL